MSSNIFLTIAIVTTGIFAVQFILSVFFGDFDADTDIDTDISSVVSFKGLTHFGIGFGWYMYLQHNTEIQTYLTGFVIGLIFVFAVWFLYKKAYQLQQTNHSEKTEQLVGRECTIYFKQNEKKYTVQVSRDGAMREKLKKENYDPGNDDYGCHTRGGNLNYIYRYPFTLPEM